MPSELISVFRHNVAAHGCEVDDRAWQTIEPHLSVIKVNRGETILNSWSVAESLVFICDGIAASFQTTADGEQQIARFFERNQLCSNITSAWHQTVSRDELVAMSDVSGVLIPFSMFRRDFMEGGPLGAYWRQKVIETLLFDKDLMCAKTVRDVDVRYRFLNERYTDVVGSVPDKYIARFLGITPQGLSRYLKKNRL